MSLVADFENILYDTILPYLLTLFVVEISFAISPSFPPFNAALSGADPEQETYACSMDQLVPSSVVHDAGAIASVKHHSLCAPLTQSRSCAEPASLL